MGTCAYYLRFTLNARLTRLVLVQSLDRAAHYAHKCSEPSRHYSLVRPDTANIVHIAPYNDLWFRVGKAATSTNGANGSG
jgi:hypothetical protein